MPETLRHLVVTRTGGIATVTLDRPPVNAVDLGVIDEFRRVVAELGPDRAVRAVIITAGRDGSARAPTLRCSGTSRPRTSAARVSGWTCRPGSRRWRSR